LILIIRDLSPDLCFEGLFELNI